jgi:nucleotide-binding universal stress UspA family protein
MSEGAPSRSVIVGVDGSKSALRAVQWAVAEALDRHAFLRLVHVINCADSEFELALGDAREVVEDAKAVVEETGQPIEVQTDILQGDPAATLVETSRCAELMCVGAKGMHDSAPAHRGATGAMVAESAHCPVILVRRRVTGSHIADAGRWVVAVLDESPASRGLLDTALAEGRRRGATVLALTPWPARKTGGVQRVYDPLGLRGRVDHCVEDNGTQGVRVRALSLPSDLTELLAQTPVLDQLVIAGMSDPDLTTELVGPRARKLLRKTNCSVMVFRNVTLPADVSHDHCAPESVEAS